MLICIAMFIKEKYTVVTYFYLGWAKDLRYKATGFRRAEYCLGKGGGERSRKVSATLETQGRKSIASGGGGN